MNSAKALLLVDNSAALELLHSGTYRFQEISFEEVRAIVEMHGQKDVLRCFSHPEIESLLYKHAGISISNFHYLPVEELAPGQDAIVFRFYVTPSETQPSIKTVFGNEATKLQNLYVYCQFVTRLDEP